MHPVLDHIVLLVPHENLANLPAWITDAFTVLDGGAHAGGETENKLIVFQDGSYIELISFVRGLDPEKRARHRWGGRPEGHIIDWALSLLDPISGHDAVGSNGGDPEQEFRKVQERIREAHAEIEYEDPVAGGRTTPAGTVLKWATASPFFTDSATDGGFSGGELPFWCLDRTPRTLRVPYEEPGKATHPSKVVGVGGVTIVFKDGRFLERASTVYDAIHGYKSQSSGGNSHEWVFPAPVLSEGRDWTLRLRIANEADGDLGTLPDVFVQLTFFTDGAPRTVSGTIGDGWKIEFDLVKR